MNEQKKKRSNYYGTSYILPLGPGKTNSYIPLVSRGSLARTMMEWTVVDSSQC